MAEIKLSNKSIPQFTETAPSIWEHTPPTEISHCSPSKDTEAPALIILCTWTGAQNRYIAKYTSVYQELFPSTKIMVIATTTKDLCFRNSERKQERLRPAVERISSLQYLHEIGHDNGILMHVFSEGGSNKACELAEAYFNITGNRLPVTALCLDSTPGHPRYLRLCNALNKSLPQVPVLRHTGLLFGSVALGAIWVTYKLVKGAENNVITRTRRRLLDTTHFNPSAPRCYLYSSSDVLIASKDVHEHAQESADAGIPVTDVIFEGSGHVGHARQDPKRYWDAVMETWRSSSPSSSSEETFKDEKARLSVVVEQVDVMAEHPSMKKLRWSDADSQRTLCVV